MLRKKYEWYTLIVLILVIIVFIYVKFYKPPGLEVVVVNETKLLKYPRYMGITNLSGNEVMQILKPGEKYNVKYIRSH